MQSRAADLVLQRVFGVGRERVVSATTQRARHDDSHPDRTSVGSSPRAANGVFAVVFPTDVAMAAALGVSDPLDWFVQGLGDRRAGEGHRGTNHQGLGLLHGRVVARRV